MKTALEGQAFCQILLRDVSGPMEIKHRCYSHSICPWEQLRQENDCLINIKIYQVWWRRTRTGGLRRGTRKWSSEVTYLYKKSRGDGEYRALNLTKPHRLLSSITAASGHRAGAFVLFAPHRSHHGKWTKRRQCRGEHSHFRGRGVNIATFGGGGWT